MGHCQPSAFSEEIKTAIETVAIQAIRAVGIENGPVHVEMKVTQDGPKMIELGARMGGDFITTHLVPLSTGIDMMKLVIKNACGEKINIPKDNGYGSAIRFFSGENGRLEDVAGMDEVLELQGVKYIWQFKESGSMITETHNSLDRVGCVIVQGRSNQEAIEICERALEKIKVKVKMMINKIFNRWKRFMLF